VETCPKRCLNTRYQHNGTGKNIVETYTKLSNQHRDHFTPSGGAMFEITLTGTKQVNPVRSVLSGQPSRSSCIRRPPLPAPFTASHPSSAPRIRLSSLVRLVLPVWPPSAGWPPPRPGAMRSKTSWTSSSNPWCQGIPWPFFAARFHRGLSTPNVRELLFGGAVGGVELLEVLEAVQLVLFRAPPARVLSPRKRAEDF